MQARYLDLESVDDGDAKVLRTGGITAGLSPLCVEGRANVGERREGGSLGQR